MSQIQILLMAIGAVLMTVTVAAVIGLLVVKRLDSKRSHSRRAVRKIRLGGETASGQH